MNFSKFPLAEYIDTLLDFLTDHLAWITKGISEIMSTGMDAATDALLAMPSWLFILLVAAAAYKAVGKRMALGTILGLCLLDNLQLWEPTIETLVLVLIATFVAVAIGIPLGILAAIYDGAHRVIMPLLDLMQTMPAFVYLIPAIPFFGLGPVAAIFSTVIFAMPPAIRLTSLGIRQVPADLVEAADAYGCDRRQKLLKLQLPLALPTIMAGVNQTIMLALSMVVIAAMIGAGGLGGEVWKAIQRLQPGKGFEAGIGIVILAMILDRFTSKVGRNKSADQ
ncbi:MAG: ABC transporter permease [Desulfobacteraceae bacterium 4572_35.2]|jgi:glycine betaine/proline transport system permease protein|nr:MAG: ABC transporter permease [Desulfobacteraceae bacterium 4572_35.2]